MNSLSACSLHPQFEQCHHKEQSLSDTLLRIIEKTSAVALGALSLYTNWRLFVPCFFVGVFVGICSILENKKLDSLHCQAASCSQGLLEQITGTKLPPIISLVANVAVTICHIDHHSTVFVPIVAVSLGNWIASPYFSQTLGQFVRKAG